MPQPEASAPSPACAKFHTLSGSWNLQCWARTLSPAPVVPPHHFWVKTGWHGVPWLLLVTALEGALDWAAQRTSVDASTQDDVCLQGTPNGREFLQMMYSSRMGGQSNLDAQKRRAL